MNLRQAPAALVALTLIALAACAPTVVNGLDALPRSIAGETLVYHTLHGADAEDWAQAVLATTDLPGSGLTSATGFTFPDANEYQSFVVRIRGAQGRALLGHLIEALGGGSPGIRREDVIDGKTVLRWQPDWGEVAGINQPMPEFYAYAFQDVAISIFSRRPQEAEEALRAMPQASNRQTLLVTGKVSRSRDHYGTAIWRLTTSTGLPLSSTTPEPRRCSPFGPNRSIVTGGCHVPG